MLHKKKKVRKDEFSKTGVGYANKIFIFHQSFIEMPVYTRCQVKIALSK